MSKRHYVEDLDDMDDSVYSILGNRFNKIAEARETRDRFRERRAAEGPEQRPPLHKSKRSKSRDQ